MDPKANIDQQRHLATALLDTIDAGAISQRPDIEDHVQCLCELVLVSQVPALPQIDKPHAWEAIDETLRNARGESHASASDVCAVEVPMSAFAMVVVLDAADAGAAYDRVAAALGPEGEFVGEPWQVQPINTDALAAGERVDEDQRLRTVAEFSPEYGTLECLDQHPER
jgi:hypothetical protein